jgi:hypothetical protein
MASPAKPSIVAIPARDYRQRGGKFSQKQKNACAANKDHQTRDAPRIAAASRGSRQRGHKRGRAPSAPEEPYHGRIIRLSGIF